MKEREKKEREVDGIRQHVACAAAGDGNTPPVPAGEHLGGHQGPPEQGVR